MYTEILHTSSEVPNVIDSQVVLGKQLGVGSSMADVRRSKDHLSFESRLNVIAAGLLWKPGMRILFSGNERALFPQAAMEYMAEHFGHIPHEYYSDPDTHSYDTQASAHNVPHKLKEEGHSNPLLVTVGFHAVRALALFNREQPVMNFAVASEDIVSERSAEDFEAINAWKSQPRIRMEKTKETLLRRLGNGGKIGSLAMKAMRP
ncbi:MAG TPA: ElyC/SanA/YdcF family protein [Candidatus Saccharimonadales bacterium]|nr:ElyC/SanA/YdcF family protein [Candidatus Saccharimonadales bacterium]